MVAPLRLVDRSCHFDRLKSTPPITLLVKTCPAIFGTIPIGLLYGDVLVLEDSKAFPKNICPSSVEGAHIGGTYDALPPPGSGCPLPPVALDTTGALH